MEPLRQRWAARLALAVLALAALGALYWAGPGRRITTDVLDLVPNDERQPELALVRSLAGDQRARVALFALDFPRGGALRQAAAEAFVGSLRASPAFEEAVLLQDPAERDALGRALFEHRLDLLLPSWIAAHRQAYERAGAGASWPEWLARQTVRELNAYLSRPEAVAYQDILTSDPLLLVPGLAASVQGLDPAGVQPGGSVLVWALVSQPPLQESGQRPVFDAVDKAVSAARAAEPDLGMRWTSLARFAAASRTRIQGELSTLNLLSAGGVVAVAAICLRRLRRALHLVPVVLGSVICAWTVTLASFPHVHVLVFVVGSLLIGVAVDYGFYLYLQAPAYPGEPYSGKAGRLLRPLMASALTAILGFSLLLLSELPLIRQLGVFVSAGLLGALVFALLWFAQVENPYMETRSFAKARLGAGRSGAVLARSLFIVGAMAALIGPWFLRWHDDIRELEIPSPALQAEDRVLRSLFGDTDNRSVYLTHGADATDARESLGRFLAWHRKAYPDAPIHSAESLLPTPGDWRLAGETRAELAGFPALLRRVLASEGFDADSFAPFYSEWERWVSSPNESYEDVARQLAGMLHGPLGTLFTLTPKSCWFVSIGEHPPGIEPPPETATASASQLETLNRLFGRYRVSALRLSTLGLGLVGLSVFALYGVRNGIRIFAVPAGACLFAFGMMGLFGMTLNLFHLTGAFLGVCLSHNYAIFSAENAARGDEPPPSIRLSAFCTAASFGVLTLSHIPVVAALGSTVTLIVLSALAIVELKALAIRAPRADPVPKP